MKTKKPRKGQVKNLHLDKYFSLLIRGRTECCERCGSTKMLQCSHHVSRKFLALRWCPLNACCHCRNCHAELTFSPHNHYEWIIDFIGKDAFDSLKSRGIKIQPYSQPERRDMLASLKSEWTWMQAQRNEGAEDRVNFISPYEVLKR